MRLSAEKRDSWTSNLLIFEQYQAENSACDPPPTQLPTQLVLQNWVSIGMILVYPMLTS